MGNGLKWIFNEYEFDNRVNNLAWTVSGKYDEEIDSSEKDYSSKDASMYLSLIHISSALQHYLIKNKLRTNVNIILETGEAKEVMHFALLIGYGATAINPYLAYETIDQLAKKEL